MLYGGGFQPCILQLLQPSPWHFQPRSNQRLANCFIRPSLKRGIDRREFVFQSRLIISVVADFLLWHLESGPESSPEIDSRNPWEASE